MRNRFAFSESKQVIGKLIFMLCFCENEMASDLLTVHENLHIKSCKNYNKYLRHSCVEENTNNRKVCKNCKEADSQGPCWTLIYPSTHTQHKLCQSLHL